ncbi:MAG: phospholipid methyltransferase, partial [Acetatifactor sp.]|nr:phospholipid methyltransferase [Acetatifactor sp.]
YLIFIKVKSDFSLQFYSGLVCYILGLGLCVISAVCFSSPDDTGMNRNGIYKFSRNPMYVAYFICFAGMALLTQSLILLVQVVVFQISAHWIILAEERWCMEKFGTTYEKYMKEVGRYI